MRDEKGALHTVVEMAYDASKERSPDRQGRGGGSGFYFLLDGQDVKRASDEAFVNLSTGEILTRVTE